MAEFTTGEAVALELAIARVPTRATAFVIDLMVQVALLVGVVFVLEVVLLPADLDSAWVEAVMLVTIVAILVGYPVAWETLSRGRSAGKFALGLRVVREDGGPIDFRHALTRGLTGVIVDFWVFGSFGAVAVITSMCSPNARRVGDVLAGTVVVHAQASLPMPALVVPPLWLTGWVTRLDLSGIPEDLALAIRQYLTRTRTLTPAAQAGLGDALVTAVCGRIGVRPPAGYPPVQILGAIVAERQRRTLTPRAAGLVRTG